jgi:Kef-type K+ transport system membrane component KefB
MPVTDFHFAETLATLVAIIIATRIGGALVLRIGQPTVLGELLAGVLLGASVFGIVLPNDNVIHTIAEIGVLILLFEIGLHVELRALARSWRPAGAVGLAGVVLSFAAGFLAAELLGLAMLPAILCGAALTATSIGISARVLSDLGQLHTPEGRIILGAAVFDDIVGLIILSVVSGLAGGEELTVAGVLWKTVVAFGFIGAAVVVGRMLVPPVFRFIERIQIAGTLGLFGLAFAFALAWLAEAAGSAMIIGAFAAGLVLHHTPQRAMVERATTEIGHFFVPVFFAFVGAAVDVRTFGDTQILLIGGALIVAAVLGKYVSGYAAWGFKGNKRVIGAAMIPRGEVGLIFAQMGLTRGIVSVPLFSALTLMVMVTTFIAPPLLKHLITGVQPPDAEARPGQGGVDDLVAGAERGLAEPGA